MKQDGKSTQQHGATPAPPHVGKPLDGTQYVDVVEEQRYADQRPTADAREPHPARPKGDQSQLTGPENIPTGN